MVTEINWDKLADMLLFATNEIIIIMPSVHEEWIDAIERNQNNYKLSLKVCIDNSEAVIRSGYGSITSMEKLKSLKAIIKQCDGLRISFISIDNQAFFIFLESRIIAGDLKGYNAVEIDLNFATSIKSSFFNTEFDRISQHLDKPQEHLNIEMLNEEQYQDVKKIIEENPPCEPDLKRKIGIYSNLFQYTEVHFEGANLQSKTISIPTNALPFRDNEFKKMLKTKLSLFTKEQTKKWDQLLDIKSRVDLLRKKYLTPCNLKKDRSILRKSDKIAFQIEYEILKKWTMVNKNNILDEVQLAINESKRLFKTELSNFLTQNPPKEVLALHNSKVKEELINDCVDKIISKTNIPTALSIISSLKLEVEYADLTIEDINDKKLLNWFKAKNLIHESDESKIADFKNAYPLKY